jgi:NTE family protein
MSKKIGVAFGGGGARGLAHIGVVKALNDSGIEPVCISGTSVGSIIGALVAAGADWKDLRSSAQSINWADLVGLSWPELGLVKSEKMGAVIEELVSYRSFDELDIPFGCVATNLQTAEPVVFTEGDLGTAVRASCSVPLIFEPVEYDDRLLVDGGLVNQVPADVARSLGAEFVLGVELSADRTDNARAKNMLDVLFQSMNILMAGTTQSGSEKADVVIAPDLHGFGYADLDRIDEAIEAGEKATHAALEAME